MKAFEKIRTSRKAAFVVAASAAMVGGGLGVAAPASAYGNTAVYQIELSANVSGHNGGGVWLWIELDQNGTGDYKGSDCGHAGQGAAPDSGDVTWTDTGGTLTITGVKLNGLGGFPTTITVPDTYGHYTGTIGSYLTLPGFIPPFIGNTQLQVAP
ncbi:hypothetical protein ACFVVC_11030 [Pseudarthrobacter sp. NPDC058196]|uniref:hypothetical protein n=1 Tax=Pseudarthrobacter sp. NPDC058196 TaxID=3346376 RepID=UPI0036D8D77D